MVLLSQKFVTFASMPGPHYYGILKMVIESLPEKPIMPANDQTTILLLAESILFLLIIGVTLARADLQNGTGTVLVVYIIVSCLWVLYEIAWRIGCFTSLPVSDFLLSRVPVYGALLLALQFLQLSRSFLRLPGMGRGWWVFGLSWLAIMAVLDSKLLPLPDPFWRGQGWQVSTAEAVFSLFVLGWIIVVMMTAWLIVTTHRRIQQPLHQNRIKYWLLALIFIVVGDVLLFIRQPALGSDLHLFGILIVAYVLMVHRLPDVRQSVRHSISYLLITLLTVGIYLSGFNAMQYWFQTVPGYNPLLAGAVVTLVLVILSQPLLSLVRRLVNWLIFGAHYQSDQILSEYSATISNILDLERLATVAIGLIHETLEIKQGCLFVVQQETDQAGLEFYHWRGIRGKGEGKPPSGTLSTQNPVAVYLGSEHRPLTQYDIDLLPRFKEMPPIESSWLSRLGMDVYVPIYTKGVWIGLIALGPKLSHDRYFDRDLVLLNTLADQTAIALENARLVEDLKNLNNNLTRAYTDLDQANRQLQELDKLKSAFIGVITHELRTPYANIIFSLEIFERYGRAYLPPELQEQLDQLTGGIKSAKQMIDNLVTFATFLSKQGQLHPALLEFNRVVQDTILPLSPLAEAKQITLHVELPTAAVTFLGDQDRLADAVYHLAHNAIKFTAAGGEVWLRGQHTADWLMFEVQDNGVGIPADKLPNLWDSFNQLADPLRRGVEGLGLGLALVKYIITAHGGEVWADSQLGQGSTFGFRLPLNDAMPEQVEPWGVESQPQPLTLALPTTQLIST